MKQERTLKEKKAMLVRLCELSVLCGYPIDGLMGRPLRYFDYDKVQSAIEKFQADYDSKLDIYHDGGGLDYLPSFR